ncbi:hypothetical protein FRB98_007762 [Tulasnella sp. 332]|nr:hypothetical protein FRB98_007762 [Tulasnella sp. 332]
MIILPFNHQSDLTSIPYPSISPVIDLFFLYDSKDHPDPVPLQDGPVLSLPRITLPLGPEDWASIAKPNLRDEMQVGLIKAARTATATLIQQGTTTASVQKKKAIQAHIDAKQLEAMTPYLRQVSNEKLASVRLAMVNGKLMILENVAKKIEGGSMA